MLIEAPKQIKLEWIETTSSINMRYWNYNWYYFLIRSGTTIFVYKDLETLKAKVQWSDVFPYAELSISVKSDEDSEPWFFSFFFDENDKSYFIEVKIWEEKMLIYETRENIYVHKKDPEIQF